MPSLPAPSEIALQHSRAVLELIQAEIVAAGGWISFARYMELALYAPGRGYYSGGSAKFGGAGDFVTAPEISTLFGRAVARQAAQVALHCRRALALA
ncbi:MAG: class I SAM-dependent methyltransferase, partial [Nitrosospira sp.]|nr:class I SAM-dependent methyltransferase [Nitrosospira sp.]